MGRLTLVTGGARSGKSDFAQGLASRAGGDDVLFVATAEALDEEMGRRIGAHRASRPPAWRTLEVPRAVGQELRTQIGRPSAVLIDCLTLLVSNELLAPGSGREDDPAEAEAAIVREVTLLLDVARASEAAFIIVSAEVGMGLVPTYPLGRLYRDLLGRANQIVAARADSVYLMVSGIPIEVKKPVG